MNKLFTYPTATTAVFTTTTFASMVLSMLRVCAVIGTAVTVWTLVMTCVGSSTSGTGIIYASATATTTAAIHPTDVFTAASGADCFTTPIVTTATTTTATTTATTATATTTMYIII